MINPLLEPNIFNEVTFDWGYLADELFEDPECTLKDVEAFLRDHTKVPAVLRRLNLDELYQGKVKSEIRLRLFGTIDTWNGEVSPSQLKRALQDQHACNVEVVSLAKRAHVNALFQTLDRSGFEPLRALCMGVAPSDEQLEAMATHPKLNRLEALVIKSEAKGCYEALAAHPVVHGLRHLGLWYTTLKPFKAMEALAATPFTNLRTFSIAGKFSVKAAAGRPFLEAPWLEGLEHLVLEDFELGDEEVALLARHPVVERLETLSLRGASSTEDTLCELLSRLRSCKRLHLQYFKRKGRGPTINARAAEALVSSGCVPNLVYTLVRIGADAQKVLEDNGYDEAAARTRRDEELGLG